MYYAKKDSSASMVDASKKMMLVIQSNALRDLGVSRENAFKEKIRRKNSYVLHLTSNSQKKDAHQNSFKNANYRKWLKNLFVDLAQGQDNTTTIGVPAMLVAIKHAK